MDVDDLSYFEIEGATSEEERAFLAALRARTEGRLFLFAVPPDWTDVDELVIVANLDAPDLALLTPGVRVLDGRLHGDRLDESYAFPNAPTPDAVDAQGSPEALADVAAAWFLALAQRQIVRWEWLHNGRVYAERYVFGDTHEPLAQMYQADWAPPGEPERLIGEGHVFGKGWIQTSGLGPPDRQVQVRP